MVKDKCVKNGCLKLRGFTLIELLVVISIIAVLMSIMMPALGRVRESAKSTVCKSNLKQLVLGLQMYDQDCGRLPHAYKAANGVDDEPLGGWWYTFPNSTDKPRPVPGLGLIWYWQQIAGKYVSAEWKVFDCPSSKIPAPSDTGRKDAPYAGNYGCNEELMPRPAGPAYAGLPATADEPTSKLASVKRPAGVALIFDCGGETLSFSNAMNPCGWRWYIPGCDHNAKGSCNGYEFTSEYQKDLIEGRHSGKKINVGWVDGSVGDIKANDFASYDRLKKSSKYWGL